MITRTVLTGLLAGLAAGLVLTLIYLAKIQPLILLAEGYDKGLDHALSAPFMRFVDTFIFNLLNGVGFGLLLAAIFTIRDRPAGVGKGVLWGLAGFAAFALAPAAGLPPELPGSVSAPLQDRQIWWILTALTTAGGLALIALQARPALKAVGAVAILIPHFVGAPHGDAYGGSLPAELAAAFVGISLGTAALFWVVLGGVAGYCHDWLGKRAQREAAA